MGLRASRLGIVWLCRPKPGEPVAPYWPVLRCRRSVCGVAGNAPLKRGVPFIALLFVVFGSSHTEASLRYFIVLATTLMKGLQWSECWKRPMCRPKIHKSSRSSTCQVVLFLLFHPYFTRLVTRKLTPVPALCIAEAFIALGSTSKRSPNHRNITVTSADTHRLVAATMGASRGIVRHNRHVFLHFSWNSKHFAFTTFAKFPQPPPQFRYLALLSTHNSSTYVSSNVGSSSGTR